MPDTYRLDLTLQKAIRQTARGEADQLDLEQLTQGRYSLEGNVIRDVETGRVLTELAPGIDHSLIQTREGHVLLARGIPTEEISSDVHGRGQVGIAFSGEFALPDGSSLSIDVPFAFANENGRIGIMPKGGSRLFDIRFINVDANLPEGARRATSGELLERAIIGKLMSKNREDLARMVAEGVTDERGKLLETETEAARFLARLNIGTLTAVSITEL